MTAPDLLPCFRPTCGGRAEYVPAFGVKCTACGLALPCTEAEAIAAWNTRATPAAMTPEVRALVEAAEDLIGQMDMSDDDDPDDAGWELYTYAGKFRRLAKALAALRAGGAL